MKATMEANVVIEIMAREKILWSGLKNNLMEKHVTHYWLHHDRENNPAFTTDEYFQKHKWSLVQ